MLQNKTILITGSSRGIGAATARLATQYGARVVLHGKTDSDELKNIANELGTSYVVADLTSGEEISKAAEHAIANAGHIDCLINCAGITKSFPFLEASDEIWEEIFMINVLGTVRFCRALIPHMQQHGGGSIVNIASIRGRDTTSGRTAYSTSKAAIINLTCSLAKEFAPAIRVNAVAPGFTKTDMSKEWGERTWSQSKQSLVGRAAEPIEIAEAVLFLASDRARYIVGQTLIVDGGYSLAGK